MDALHTLATSEVFRGLCNVRYLQGKRGCGCTEYTYFD